MKNKHTALRALLWAICIYHVVFGLLANLPAETMRGLAATLLGFSLPAVPALDYVVKPFGIYVIAFGVMMGVAAWNPVKNRALISIGVVLFVLRAAQRLIHVEEMQDALGVTPARNLIAVCVVVAFAVALLGLRWKLHCELHAAEAENLNTGA
jgi:putative Ca2+/H+ antiporter (TMEM165/GDT1 family)